MSKDDSMEELCRQVLQDAESSTIKGKNLILASLHSVINEWYINRSQQELKPADELRFLGQVNAIAVTLLEPNQKVLGELKERMEDRRKQLSDFVSKSLDTPSGPAQDSSHESPVSQRNAAVPTEGEEPHLANDERKWREHESPQDAVAAPKSDMNQALVQASALKAVLRNPVSDLRAAYERGEAARRLMARMPVAGNSRAGWYR